MPRLLVGLFTLGAAAPVIALEWRDLALERDALQARVDLLESARAPALGDAWSGSASPALEPAVPYAGADLPDASALELARAVEGNVSLATEAASLRRQLARTRAELDGWVRPEGSLDMRLADPSRGSAVEQDPVMLGLAEEGDALRRRLARAGRDMDEVQLERDEALAQLRREMFSNLTYSAIIGECGQRTGRRAFDDCAIQVRAALNPRWRQFEACVLNYNAIPAYSQDASAQSVMNALRLDRGAVLMCDPGLPEGGLGG